MSVERGRGAGALLLILVSAGAIAAAFFAIVPAATAIGLVAVLIWFALPGLVLARCIYGSASGSWAAALLAGPAWGYALSSLALLAGWALGARALPLLLLAPIPAALLVWPLRALMPRLTLPRFTRGDAPAVALVLLAVPAIVGLPFAHIGEDLPEGRAYRAYFTADFVWQMAVASEVSKGDMPPQNPYYAGEPLHYYWLVHLLPSAVHRAAGTALRVEQPLLVNDIWWALAFVAFLFFFTRHFVDCQWAAALGCIGVLFCSSFEGAERLWTFWRNGESAASALQAVRDLNIDSMTGWVYGSLRVDGLQRLLLYQPQHQAGYVLGFSALLLLAQARERITLGVLFLAGLFLALALLMSPFAAAVFAVVLGFYAAVRMAAARQWAWMVPGALVAALPVAAAFALTALLRYADPDAQVVSLGVNPLAVRRWPIALFLSFGPVFILAAGAMVPILRRRLAGVFLPALTVVAVCFLFYFLVDVPDVQGVYVGFHVGKIAFAAFAPLCAFAVDRIGALRGVPRVVLGAGTAIVALLALPTVLIDLYNTQDIHNRHPAPFGGNWTLVLSRGELAGLDWIKRFTDSRARVQMEPIARERGAWAYVPAFAERRMSAGMPTSMVPLDKYQRASDRVKAVYESASAGQAHQQAVDLCIDYLIVGEPERRAHPQVTSVLESNLALFRPVFRNGVLDVYAVERVAGDSAVRCTVAP
jgi:hypothetical protein